MAESSRRRRAADGEQVVDWPVAMPDAQSAPLLQGLPNEGFGAADGLPQPDTLREQGRDGGRKRAARAVRVARFDPRAHEALDAGGVAQDVDRLLAAAVPALEKDRMAPQREERLGLRDHLGLARGLPGIEQAGGSRQVGRDQEAVWEQLRLR